METNEKKVKNTLIDLRNSIKKKFNELHNQKLAMSESLQDYYEPITTPLNKILQSTIRNKSDEKTGDILNLPAIAEENEIDERMANVNLSDVASNENDSNASYEDANETNESDSSSRNADNSDVINDKYFKDYMRIIDSPQHDKNYGMRRVNERYMIGNTVVYLDEINKQLSVNRRRFPLTSGLLSLLILKSVKKSNCNRIDLLRYKDILLITNAHRKYYDANKDIRTSTIKKFTDIILPLMKENDGDRNISGRGLSHKKCRKKIRKHKNSLETDFLFLKRKTTPDFVFWDNPNELIDRLKLLLSSQSAGNNAHTNEINSIVEELREAKIIK